MSFLKKLTVSDYLFGVQTILTFAFCGSQCYRMLESTEGLNITWFTHWFAFSAILLLLAVRADKALPSREAKQLIASYALWAVGAIVSIAFMLALEDDLWNGRDLMNMFLTAGGAMLVIAIARLRGLPLLPRPDPVVKGMLAICFKAMPQLIMGYNFVMSQSCSGLSWVALVIGHCTIWIRLSQLALIVKRAGWKWNRDDIGIAVAETGNEASWIVVTIIWLHLTFS